MPRRCACGRSARRWTEEVECLLESVKPYRSLPYVTETTIGPCVTLHSLVPRSDAPPLNDVGGTEGQTITEAGRARLSRLVHDSFPEGMELAGGLHRLCEKVGDVVRCAHEGHLDLEGFDHVADEEVTPLHVLHAIVVFRVV